MARGNGSVGDGDDEGDGCIRRRFFSTVRKACEVPTWPVAMAQWVMVMTRVMAALASAIGKAVTRDARRMRQMQCITEAACSRKYR